MPLRALIADDDVEMHEFLCDLLELNFKDIEIDKALSQDGFLKKLSNPARTYNLVFLDYYLDIENGKDIISTLHEQASQILDRIVLLNGSAEDVAGDVRTRNMPVIRKPVSLDNFGEIVKKTCVDC